MVFVGLEKQEIKGSAGENLLDRSTSPLDMSHIEKTNLSKSRPYKKRKVRFVVNPTSNASKVIRTRTSEKSVMNGLTPFYRFSKPYTLIGLALSVFSISLLAVEKLSDLTPAFFLGVSQAVVGSILANMYVAGINQLSDIEIDKVNKPYLPLASGIISIRTGVLLTSLYAILGFWLGLSVGSWPLQLGLFLWFAFGTAYSVNIPLLRWKRIPVLAALSISSGQGVVVPILFYLHAQTYVFGRPAVLSKHIIFVAVFMTIHSVVLAVFKDIPDVEGDRLHGIKSFALQLGQKRVFWICICLLEVAYGVGTLIGLSSSNLWIKIIMVISHSTSGFILWKKANSVDTKKNDATESFYIFLWKLYYAEYLLVPILRF